MNDVAKVTEQIERFHSFPREVQLLAEIDQLKKRLSRIYKLGTSTFDQFIDESRNNREIVELKGKIRNETDMYSMNLTEALEFCEKHIGTKSYSRSEM